MKTQQTRMMNNANIWFHFGDWHDFKYKEIGTIVPKTSWTPPPLNEIIADMWGKMITTNAHTPNTMERSTTRCQQNSKWKIYM